MNYNQDIIQASGFCQNFDDVQESARKACEKVLNYNIPLLKLPQHSDDIDKIDHSVAYLNKFSDVVVLGTGGSSLGAQTLAGLKGYGLSCNKNSPRLHFMDNIDPTTFDLLLNNIDLESTGVIVISKSGTTAETLCQCLLMLQHFTAKKLLPSKHFVAITEPKDSQLTQIAKNYNITTYDHDPNLGGRFSVLSIVGLMPAMLAGVDAKQVRKGAQQMLDNPDFAIQGAALNFALLQQNINQTVLMPYIDRLSFMGLWFRQLWAESVGKNGKGTTPIRAMGTVDQHSQLQLYLDGPKDKLFTVITGSFSGQGSTLSDPMAPDYLHGRTMGDLMAAEQRATIIAMQEKKCPTRVIDIPVLNEQTMGALLMQFMLETMIMAELLGVDAFDQPAVERGKILAKQYMQDTQAA